MSSYYSFAIPVGFGPAALSFDINPDYTVAGMRMTPSGGANTLTANGVTPGYLEIPGMARVMINCGTINVGQLPAGENILVRVDPYDIHTFRRYIGEITVTRGTVEYGGETFLRKYPAGSVEIYVQTDLKIQTSEFDNNGSSVRIFTPGGMVHTWAPIGEACNKWTPANVISGYPNETRFGLWYSDNYGICVPAMSGICHANNRCHSTRDAMFGFVYGCFDAGYSVCSECPKGQQCGFVNGVSRCVPVTDTVCARDQDYNTVTGECQPAVQPCTRDCYGRCFNATACLDQGLVCGFTHEDPERYSCTADPVIAPAPRELAGWQVALEKYALPVAGIGALIGVTMLGIWLAGRKPAAEA